MKSFKNILAEIVATSFYVGKIKYCPGTFGSIVAFPLYFVLAIFVIRCGFIFHFSDSMTISWLILLGICILLYFVGLYFTNIYLTHLNERSPNNPITDPKEVVIDEVVGQLLVIILHVPAVYIYYSRLLPEFLRPFYQEIFGFVLPFTLFRVFDILKPWPISWFDENIKGAQGVMIDDIIAAVFASFSYYAIILLLINFT